MAAAHDNSPDQRPDCRALRIGILKTDSVRQEFQLRHGDYPDMFRALLLEAATVAGLPAPVFVVHDVQHGDYPAAADDCDGYLITGSRDSVYDDLPWIEELTAFVRTLHDRRHKLVGICFGHQLVARALGGEAAAAPQGWAVGVHEATVVAPAPWMQPADERFALLSSHRDQVLRLPDEARLVAGNDFCPHAAFTVGEHILAIQGHPEFEKPYAAELMQFRRELLGEAVFRAGMASLDRPLQRTLVGQWILEFLYWRAAGQEEASLGRGER